MSDNDEINIDGTDPFNPDTDGDGFLDGEEIFSLGSDPLDPLSPGFGGGGATTSGQLDADNDGLSDDDEVFTYGTDPTNPDTDGDGFLDGDEVADGFDPTDPNN